MINMEPGITEMIQSVAEEFGGYPEGLAARWKKPYSLHGVMYDRPTKKTIDEVNDIVRYTIILPIDEYVEGAQKLIERFKADGCSVYSQLNFRTMDIPYQGINLYFMDADSKIIEVQVHTAQSFEVKNSEEDHTLYERRRLLEPGTPEYEEILNQQWALYAVIEVPEGIESIETIRPGTNEERNAALAEDDAEENEAAA